MPLLHNSQSTNTTPMTISGMFADCDIACQTEACRPACGQARAMAGRTGRRTGSRPRWSPPPSEKGEDRDEQATGARPARGRTARPVGPGGTIWRNARGDVRGSSGSHGRSPRPTVTSRGDDRIDRDAATLASAAAGATGGAAPTGTCAPGFREAPTPRRMKWVPRKRPFPALPRQGGRARSGGAAGRGMSHSSGGRRGPTGGHR